MCIWLQQRWFGGTSHLLLRPNSVPASNKSISLKAVQTFGSLQVPLQIPNILVEDHIGSWPGIHGRILLVGLFDRFSLHLSPAFCGKVESTWAAGAASLTPEHKGSRLTLELKNAVAVSQRNFKGLLQHSMHKSQIFATAWDLNCWFFRNFYPIATILKTARKKLLS